MFVKSSLITLAIAAAIPEAFARPLLYPRRFGQEQCGGIGGEIGAACNGAICGVLGGRVPGTLLAGAAICAQQDLADDIIDASKTQDAATAAKMVELAIKFRQCEKNTPPDFSTNPPTLRNSVFCQKAPRNAQLVGLNQAQDPANDPDLFFDPETKTTVRKGSQANTSPLAGGAAAAPAENNNNGNNNNANQGDANNNGNANQGDANNNDGNAGATGSCPPQQTVTVTAQPNVTGTCPPAATVTVTATENKVASTPAAAAPAQTVEAAPSGALNFGSCTNPAVEFGPGFEGRKLAEFSFQPQNRNEFAQSSALNGQIVLNAICNILADKCKAPAETVTACRNAITAVANVAGGAKADQFNAALGIETNFAQVPAAVGGGAGDAALASKANFNKCDVPTVQFGIFDGRKENSFAPSGKGFVHGSALNGKIITTFICDRVKSDCDANTVAIQDCTAAIAASDGLTGQAFADAFNNAVKKNV
ncbi:SubName: Full=Uncharacterized protein {ECO:0000313/EMBL:CCA69522.1} [Serendipita indica DSM 11827]|uniref:Uncharacterized protein n=1 Tax=Serendipita indica (strain DSM 11827) TaxID=1109443 RepID=G4TDZ5_SERID|nr:SubName: Full=Uncharacterized protein {ECO:0000313/EMBL:CCA69522.1} [Serendipita indica DSM 11827]CCA69522.1 hypothetical protein PIIN_03461 [Serendipita indica DSM 11827]